MLNKANNKIVGNLALWFVVLTASYLLSILPYWSMVDDLYNDYWRRHIAANATPHSDIVIIEIDDKSLTELEQQFGRWPWPRSLHGHMVEQLTAAKAKAIVFDILFVERDAYRPKDDKFFNESLDKSDRVFYAATLLSDGAPIDPISLDLLPKKFIYSKLIDETSAPEVKIALPWVITDPSKWNIGLINFFADWDGVAREYRVVSETEGWKLHSLPSQVVRQLTGREPALDGETIQLKFRGINRVPFSSISYSDAWYEFESGKLSSSYEDKIIVIGATATGLHDLRATPISKIYPATSMLATAIDNLYHQESLKQISNTYPKGVLIGAVILLLILFKRTTEYRNQLLAVLSFVFLLGLGLLVLSFKLSERDFLFPAIQVFGPFTSVAVGLLFYYGLQEYLNKRHALKTFSRFMDPVVVKQLMADEDWQKSVANKTSQVSVLFSDIRGFTSLSEKRTAEEIMTILNDYFDSQVEAIFKWQGTLDKFIGDAIMAFWGAPLEDKAHAKNAIEAALQMVENLMEFRNSLPEELRDFDVGIGIHSGDAVVGMLGSAKRFDYTAIGDTVNLASRIEGKTKGIARILVSESTKALCEDSFHFEYKGQFAVKGREEEVKLYQPSRRESEDES